MNDVEGAPGVNFNGIKQTDFLAEIEAAAADDAAIADLESELKMKRDVRDDNAPPSTKNAQRSVSASRGVLITATTARSTEQWASSANRRRNPV